MRAQLSEAAAAVRTAIQELMMSVEDPGEPRIGDGAPLVDTTGLEPCLASAMLADVIDVQMRLTVLSTLVRRTLPK